MDWPRHWLPTSLGPEALPYLTLLFALLAILLLAMRLPLLGTLVRLGITIVLGTWVATLLAERAPFDPYLARIAAALRFDKQEVTGDEVHVPMARDGHFWVTATIDGVERRMLVDSGATVTGLSAATAQAAGLKPDPDILPVLLRTANGTIRARTAKVDELALGTIRARRLAVVVSPAFGDTDILGMNFLSQLKSWRVEGRTLVLVPHHPTHGTSDAD